MSDITKLPETFKSERLKLRAFHSRDATQLAKLAGVYSVAKFTLGIPLPYSRSEAKAWIAGLPARRDQGIEHIYAICTAGARALIGAISLAIEPEHQRIEIGYWLAEPARGNGYATEALRLLLPHIFSAGYTRIYALCFLENLDSMRLLSKLGFIREGRLRQHIVKWDEPCDVICFGMTAARAKRCGHGEFKSAKALAVRAQRP